ncbi:subtilisin-like protein protease SBT5.3 [Cinnamomum micranthum f. kanehirae]|uniref:Subtilisin-like protein protease SBT5.3 n=1 Tax=Cinnamomum micranthum f. kanehirae TaxID=337451 RepID=A0A3S3N4V5_9MAGN|nr:subtilisin-like protein protease SBT5.3 [Cinnamomum micranthum f. kanehirae]
MAPLMRSSILYLFIYVLVAAVKSCFASQVYVVYMGSKTNGTPDEILRQNHQMLSAVHQGSMEKAQASHVYSYRHGFRGFAARLTEEQVAAMAKLPGVISVFPNFKRTLHTTHSWDFMGLVDDEAMGIPGYSTKNQDNVIIGFIDTGIWPESPSFNDLQMPPVPPRWKGECEVGEAFNASSCNRKIIGARYYVNGYEAEEESSSDESLGADKIVRYRSARDSSGHGSHTASTATGRYVDNINFEGLARGGARGGARMARIAVYKACWDSGCYDADILAAFDDAIKDGVDILSISLGPESPQGEYFNDAISVGSFHATSHGILVVSSVGNEGSSGSATNLAPWMMTVSASSTDRDFTSDIVLGDGTFFKGASLSRSSMNAAARIMYASEAYAGYFTPYQSSFCLESSLNSTKVRGKVLVCRNVGSSSESRLGKSIVVRKAGGVGMVLIDEGDDDVAIPFVIPAAIVGQRVGDKILSYVNHTRKPRSLILPAKTVLDSEMRIKFAATVLDKRGHAITADPEGRLANPFDYGAGFVNPTNVLNPGLIYDAQPVDYKDFLCSIGYDENSVRLVTGNDSVCNHSSSQGMDLNYPSISVPDLKSSFSVKRTVTNVGNARSVYKVVVYSPREVNVTVSPKYLIFNKYGQKISFTVNFKAVAPSNGYVFGSLTWKKKNLRVTIPLVVRIASSATNLSR